MWGGEAVLAPEVGNGVWCWDAVFDSEEFGLSRRAFLDVADGDVVILGDLLEVGGIVGHDERGAVHDSDGRDHHVDFQDLPVESAG